MEMRAALIFTFCGAVFGYILAQAEMRDFCTGHYNEQTKVCRPF